MRQKLRISLLNKLQALTWYQNELGCKNAVFGLSEWGVHFHYYWLRNSHNVQRSIGHSTYFDSILLCRMLDR